MSRVDQATNYFLSGYNCCQAVFLAYCDLFGVEPAQGEALTAAFGGGMGGLREKCGAVCAMFMLAGLYHNGYDRSSARSKKELYSFVRQLNQDFEDVFETGNCRELLKKHGIVPSKAPSERTSEYYQKRPCVLFVKTAAEIVEKRILQKFSK